MIGAALDAVLAAVLVWLAWRCVASADLFRGVVLFIALGLVLALAWVRLDAPDIALAEAAIGAGLTGALLLDALARIRANTAGAQDGAEAGHVPSRGVRVAALLGCALLFALLAWTIASLPPEASGLAPLALERIGESGVANPVTAVLLNFRAYDTLLEVAVLLLAFLGAGCLSARAGADAVPAAPPGGLLLEGFARRMLPLMFIVAGYLLWAGASAPGGAFQAGAVLAGAGLLAAFSGLARPPGFGSRWWRVAAVSGFALFLGVAVLVLVAEGRLLQYPHGPAGALILAIEAGLVATTACVLVAFFAGRERSR